jgi:hypothetical protein
MAALRLIVIGPGIAKDTTAANLPVLQSTKFEFATGALEGDGIGRRMSGFGGKADIERVQWSPSDPDLLN